MATTSETMGRGRGHGADGMGAQDATGTRRIDGWKAIAAYFNRDRTTAMRWARERGLPVRRMPGGKQGSVFAFEHELAAWALSQTDIVRTDGSPSGATSVHGGDRADRPQETGEAAVDDGRGVEPSGTIDEPARVAGGNGRGKGRWVVGAAAAVVLLGGVGAWSWRAQAPTTTGSSQSLAMPRDPAVARDYVAARDAWARRTPADLQRAVRLYDDVIRRDPRFAPARVGLAEAWLILREYGAIDEPTAYRNARRHAEAALRIDPQLPSAHRALGFIDYWWDSQPDRAVARFRRALALDDRDAQTHFWYANMLADLGQDPLAQSEYDKARLLDPGSRVIEVEQACSHWQAGRDALALQQLTALAEQRPDDATIHNCLAWARISQGDIRGFAQSLRARARSRGEPRLLRLSAALDAAIARDPDSAVDVLIAEGRREIAAGERQLRETPAFYASAMGNRDALVQLMVEAGDLGEHWPSVPVTRRIAARWPGDPQVQRLLRRLTSTSR